MRYATIVADPPWDYGVDHARWVNGNGNQGVTRPAIPYQPMTLDAIKELRVVDLAAPDARLFLWTTNRFLRSAFDVLDAWGFAYRQTFVWHKTHGPSPFGGSVAPNHAEFLLVAVRGAPAVLARAASSVVMAPKQAHSAKPDTFLDLVEQVSPGPYLEMFSRRARLGWQTWGDQSLHGTELAA